MSDPGLASGVMRHGGYDFFTANRLKIIVMALMFLDHFAVLFLPNGSLEWSLSRLAPRVVAPVICFFIAEGYCYTSNRKKYIFRLFILALVSHYPFNITFGYTFFQATSVIWALTMGLVALTALKSEKIHIVLKPVILAVCCAAAYTANWNFVAVLWIVAFGLFHGNFKRQMLAFCAVGIVFHLALVYHRFAFSHWFQLGIFLAIPLLAMYNGRLGKKSKIMAYSFYVFYPAHLLFLHFLNLGTPLAAALERLLSP
ncbi:MAG: conjugal transfer protein TraX [Treponema sp.]|nr:conjugal transfer protein TraX [Treponema sp.]